MAQHSDDQLMLPFQSITNWQCLIFTFERHPKMIFSKEKCCFSFPVHKSSLLRAILISSDHQTRIMHRMTIIIVILLLFIHHIHPDNIHPDDSQIDVHRPPKSLCSARRTRKPLTQEELHSQRDQGMMVATFPFLWICIMWQFGMHWVLARVLDY